MSDKFTWLEGIPVLTKCLSPKFLTGEWRDFVFREDDVLILAFPKSGTHWMMEILSLIRTKGDPKWIQSVPIWDRSPWLEAKNLYEALEAQEGPRLISSHLPIQLLPKSLFTSKTKSHQLHCKYILRGSCKEMDTRSTIEKICQFLGKTLEPEELNSVLKHSSFQAMRENKMSNYTLADGVFVNLKNGSFLRKGISGDWRNHLTVAQAEAFDRAFQEKMAGLPPELFPWE
ncbi:sulfotransferase 2A1-like isoform X3 [Erinaceus europaeus]|uniref:Sulfotransferase n=1 Tax=Erinaceus europaeus TaxID=9365 RepID=A0ABM3VXU2_ERIEU|nr:sulfotransferase 2A1-like isoform X3 [Erinaceus europaeus]